MLRFNYRLVPDTYGKNAVKAADLTPIQLTRIVTEAIEIARSEIAPRAPVGWSGTLRSAYQTEVTRAGTKKPRGALLNPTIYHDPVEKGRLPGKMPPVAPLIPWVGSKLGVPPADRERVAFLVARKIGAHGTPAQNMVAEGWAVARKRLNPLLKEAGLRIVKVMK